MSCYSLKYSILLLAAMFCTRVLPLECHSFPLSHNLFLLILSGLVQVPFLGYLSCSLLGSKKTLIAMKKLRLEVMSQCITCDRGGYYNIQSLKYSCSNTYGRSLFLSHINSQRDQWESPFQPAIQGFRLILSCRFSISSSVLLCSRLVKEEKGGQRRHNHCFTTLIWK